MLTGDRKEAAKSVADALGLDGYRFELLPHEKVDALKEICGNDTSKTLYVGDGINDGPVLVTSETGIAMGGFGSQVAVEAADVVILDDSPLKVAELIRIARKTRVIVWENITMALAVKGVFMLLGAVGLAGLWEAVFADVGVALLAILNATRAASAKT
jgi:Cd2+/Zn2+-exporting ATPase